MLDSMDFIEHGDGCGCKGCQETRQEFWALEEHPTEALEHRALERMEQENDDFGFFTMGGVPF